MAKPTDNLYSYGERNIVRFGRTQKITVDFWFLVDSDFLGWNIFARSGVGRTQTNAYNLHKNNIGTNSRIVCWWPMRQNVILQSSRVCVDLIFVSSFFFFFYLSLSLLSINNSICSCFVDVFLWRRELSKFFSSTNKWPIVTIFTRNLHYYYYVYDWILMRFCFCTYLMLRWQICRVCKWSGSWPIYHSNGTHFVCEDFSNFSRPHFVVITLQ